MIAFMNPLIIQSAYCKQDRYYIPGIEFVYDTSRSKAGIFDEKGYYSGRRKHILVNMFCSQILESRGALSTRVRFKRDMERLTQVVDNSYIGAPQQTKFKIQE